MRPAAHTHRCTRCAKTFFCRADVEQNFDGMPDVICVSYHKDAHTQCDECYATPWCENCGEHAATQVVDGDKLCARCAVSSQQAAGAKS